MYEITAIGSVQSPLTSATRAPLQAHEGAPPAWVTLDESYAPALEGLEVGEEVLLLTWLDRADRTVLRVHPRGDPANPERGVFGTRSPDRPNPIGLHRTTIVELAPPRVKVSALEALDGTPVIDIKAVLGADDR